MSQYKGLHITQQYILGSDQYLHCNIYYMLHSHGIVISHLSLTQSFVQPLQCCSVILPYIQKSIRPSFYHTFLVWAMHQKLLDRFTLRFFSSRAQSKNYQSYLNDDILLTLNYFNKYVSMIDMFTYISVCLET